MPGGERLISHAGFLFAKKQPIFTGLPQNLTKTGEKWAVLSVC
jgi:hypothetical protein